MYPLTHFVSQQGQVVERWRVVVVPVEVGDAAVEPLFLVGSLAAVEDVILVAVIFIEEAFDL